VKVMADDEDNSLMTLDEYKRQREAKKNALASVVPKLNIRTAGEGEDPSCWEQPQKIYRKGNIDHASQNVSGEENVQKESELCNPCQLPNASSNSYHVDQDDEHQSSPSHQATHTSTADEYQQTLPQHPYLRAQSGSDNGKPTVDFSPLSHKLLLYLDLREWRIWLRN
jgi:hypothetical protein